MAGIFVVIVACSMLITQATSSCPQSCSCQEAAAVDNQAGNNVDCANLYLGVFPSSMPTDVLRLDFSYNSLDRVPNQIRQLTELRQLNLSTNRIHYPVQNNIFENNVQLLILDLSSNRISSFSPNAFVGLGRLEVLDIHNNLIVSIPADVLRPLSPTVSMCIGDNHWRCDCDLYYSLVERFLFVQRNASKTCRGGEPECTSPDALYGKLFSKISGDEELCGSGEEQSSSTLPLSTAALTTVVFALGGTSSVTTRQGSTTTNQSVVSTSNGEMTEVNVTPRDLFVVGQEQEEGLFLTQEIVTYGIIVVGGMVLIIFLLLTVLFSRMVSKRRCVNTDSASDEESGDHTAVSPWPLLQSQRRLPPIVPAGNDSSCGNSDYQEIPVKFVERDYRDYREAKEDEEDEFLGGTGKALYMTSIGNDREHAQLASANTKTPCTDAYIPMHAPDPMNGPMKHPDLYSPCETQNN